METFGLLKLLTSLLENPQSTPSASETEEVEENKIPPTEQPVERENAFLKMMQSHDERSKRIDKFHS